MMNKYYYEDFVVEEVNTVGSYTVSEKEIIEYANRWDPQPYHTDPDKAKDSIFGGTKNDCECQCLDSFLSTSTLIRAGH